MKVAGTESVAPSAILIVSFTAIVIYFIIQCDPGQMKTPDSIMTCFFWVIYRDFNLLSSRIIYKKTTKTNIIHFMLPSKLKPNFSSKFLEDLEIESSSLLAWKRQFFFLSCTVFSFLHSSFQVFPPPTLINNGGIGDGALFCHLTFPPHLCGKQPEMLLENRLQMVCNIHEEKNQQGCQHLPELNYLA